MASVLASVPIAGFKVCGQDWEGLESLGLTEYHSAEMVERLVLGLNVERFMGLSSRVSAVAVGADVVVFP